MGFYGLAYDLGHPGIKRFGHNKIIRELLVGDESRNRLCGRKLHLLGNLCGAAL